MPTPAHPDSPRDPHLAEAPLRLALDELDAKIQTLRNRAHATALEAKRARLAEQLSEAPAPTDGPEPSVWAQIRRGIDGLRDDVRAIL